jgi:hypothetical protein
LSSSSSEANIKPLIEGVVNKTSKPPLLWTKIMSHKTPKKWILKYQLWSKWFGAYTSCFKLPTHRSNKHT